MKVLHVFSSTQWTGAAEEVVNLCRALQDRGTDVTIACAGETPGVQSPLGARASEQGIRTLMPFRLGQRGCRARNVRDICSLRQCIGREKFDIVHAHTQADHFFAGFAARHTRCSPLVLRTSRCSDGMSPSPANRILLARYTDGLITPSKAARARDMANFALPVDRVWTVYSAVDTVRFSPARGLPDMRSRFGLSDEHFVLEVAPRAQLGGAPDLLLEVLERASTQVGGLRILIIGRGGGGEAPFVQPDGPVRMQNAVALPAESCPDGYVAALSALDTRLFVPPFANGACGALLEAMAVAKPCIVPARGALAEIVTQGVDGLVVGEDPLAVCGAIVRLARARRLRRDLGANAREKVVRDFSLEAQALLVDNIYRSLIRLRPRKPSVRNSGRLAPLSA